MSLKDYQRKRDFKKTAEPGPVVKKSRAKKPIFVIQEHHASHLHWDFRLESDGVLKSWAVPKEPTMDPAIKRLAVQVEDHPLAYATFHGDIPQGQYGGGHVDIWDHGVFDNVMATKPQPLDVTQSIEAGHVEIDLHGNKLTGRFALVRLKNDEKKRNWLLIKMQTDAPPAPARRAAKPVTPRAAKPKNPPAREPPR